MQLYLASVKCVMVHEKFVNLVKNICMHNKWEVFLKTNHNFRGCVQTSMTGGGGDGSQKCKKSIILDG